MKVLELQKAAIEYFLKKSKDGILSAQIATDLNAGLLEVVPTTIIHRFIGTSQTEGGTNGTVELLTSSNQKSAGISDFNSDKLAYPAAVYGVSLGYATPANTVTNAGATLLANVSSGVAAALQNSKLEIDQQGKPVFDVAVRRLVNQAAATEVNKDSLMLDSFALLNENVETTIRLRTPAAIDAGSSKVANISVEMQAFVLRRRR